MAFIARNLKGAAPLGAAGSIWTYKTEDSTYGVSGYFNDAAMNLRVGDVIYITQVTNMGKTTEAWVATQCRYVVTGSTPIQTSV